MADLSAPEEEGLNMYRVIGEEVTVLKKVGEAKDQYGTVLDEHISVTYVMGDEIPDKDVAPTVQKAYEDGDEHIRSLLEYVADKAPEKPLKAAPAPSPTPETATPEAPPEAPKPPTPKAAPKEPAE